MFFCRPLKITAAMITNSALFFCLNASNTAVAEDKEAKVIAAMIEQLGKQCTVSIDRAAVSYENELAVGAYFDQRGKRYQVIGNFELIDFNAEKMGAIVKYRFTKIPNLPRNPSSGDSAIILAPITPFVVLVGSAGYQRSGQIALSLNETYATKRHYIALRNADDQRGLPITDRPVRVTFSSPVTGQTPFVKMSNRDGSVSIFCANLDRVYVYAEASGGRFFDGMLDLNTRTPCLALGTKGGFVCSKRRRGGNSQS